MSCNNIQKDNKELTEIVFNDKKEVYGDISKYKKYDLTEIENIIKTTNVDYETLDEHNKILYNFYSHQFSNFCFLEDKNYHKFYHLHSDNKDEWKEIFELPKHISSYDNDYYLYVVYKDDSYEDIIEYELIDFVNEYFRHVDIIEHYSCLDYDFRDFLFIFDANYLKDIEINPNLQNLTKRGSDGDGFTVIYPHLFTEYNFDGVFDALFFNPTVKEIATTRDSSHWDNWALTKKFTNKYDEEKGLIEQVIFNGKYVDFVNKVNTNVDKLSYDDSSIYFTVSYFNNIWSNKYKATFLINENYYLDDVLIEKINDDAVGNINKTILPIDKSIDTHDDINDGIYHVRFTNDDVLKHDIDCTLYSIAEYKEEDILNAKDGDSIRVNLSYEADVMKKVFFNDDKTIFSYDKYGDEYESVYDVPFRFTYIKELGVYRYIAFDAGGHPCYNYEDDRRIVMSNDLELIDESSGIEKEYKYISGIFNVAEYIKNSDEIFDEYNTTIEIRNNKIVKIRKVWIS